MARKKTLEGDYASMIARYGLEPVLDAAKMLIALQAARVPVKLAPVKKDKETKQAVLPKTADGEF